MLVIKPVSSSFLVSKEKSTISPTDIGFVLFIPLIRNFPLMRHLYSSPLDFTQYQLPVDL